MKRSTVLVTGGAGFIGSHVVDRLAAAGHTPRIFDVRRSPWHGDEVESVIGDLLSVDALTAAAEGCAAICHLGAAADVGEVLEAPLWATELNTMGTANVLEAARRAAVGRVVYASTVWVYSDVEAEEVDEDTQLVPPAHLYTAGKLAGELFCRSYGELYDVESTIVRFGIPYGPRARPAAVIPAFVARAQQGEPLTIAGTGEQERSFVYVEDLAEGVVRALAPVAAGRTYNLAGRETTTVRGLADIVNEVVAPVEISHSPGRAGDLKGAAVLSDRAEQELGWRATTPLREGVRRYADWVAAQAGAEVEAVPAPSTTPAPPRERTRLRAVVARVTAAAVDPALIGIVALVAIVSSLLPQLIATRGDANAAGITTIALALVLPLWSVTVARWPGTLLRAQVLVAGGFGLLGVLLSACVGADALGRFGHEHWFVTLALSLCLSRMLMVLPARLVAEEA